MHLFIVKRCKVEEYSPPLFPVDVSSPILAQLFIVKRCRVEKCMKYCYFHYNAFVLNWILRKFMVKLLHFFNQSQITGFIFSSISSLYWMKALLFYLHIKFNIGNVSFFKKDSKVWLYSWSLAADFNYFIYEPNFTHFSGFLYTYYVIV